MARLPQRLLALTPGTLHDGASTSALLRGIGQAFEAGLPAVLLREPELSDGALHAFACEVVELATRFEDRWVGVHDRVHVALAAGADGAHLGFRSMPPLDARAVAGDALALGLSAHAHDDAPSAWEGADYLTFGPVRETPSKHGLLEPTGFARLEEAVRLAGRPLFALGGMTPEDAPSARAAGAGLAALGGILGASDPAGRTRAFLAALDAQAEVPR